MAQHDYVINNDSGANVRADINNALLAISSNNSGSSAPSTTYAYEWFLDTSNNLLKIRNAANNAYITVPIDIANSNRTPDSLTIGTAAAGDRTVTINSAGTPFGSIEANNSGTKLKLTAGNTGSTGCSMEFYTAASSGTETLAFTLGADQSALFAGAMTVTGATQFNNTVTVGVDDTGYDVKLFGATSGAYLLWDESDNALETAGAAEINIVKDKLKIGGTAVTTTAAELNTLDGVAATLTATELNYVDGVTSALQTQLDTKATTGKAIAMALVFG